MPDYSNDELILDSFLDYDAFANALRDIDKRDDVLVTVWQGIVCWLSPTAVKLTNGQTVSDWQVVLRVRDIF